MAIIEFPMILSNKVAGLACRIPFSVFALKMRGLMP